MAALDISTLPLLPLNTGVVLPGMVVTLALETPEALAAADAAKGADNLVVLVSRLSGPSGADGTPDGSGSGRYARVGTVAKMENSGELPGGVRAVVVRGLHRAVIGTGMAGASRALWVSIERAEETSGDPSRAAELAKEYRLVMENILERRGMGRFAELLQAVSEPGAVADTAGYSPDLSMERKVELLETLDVEERLTKAVRWMRDVLAEIELKERIRTDVSEGMEKTQREFLLRQQLAAIRKELGDSDSGDGADDYRARAGGARLPRHRCASAVEKEIDRLERTNEQSPEGGWIRTWLDTMFELPWGVRSDDRLDITEARAVLDADHTGLDDVKDRIIEYLAVRKLRSERGLDDVVDDAAARSGYRRHDPGAGRSSRSRQDQPGRVGGGRHGSPFRPGRPRRRPRRGRDQRAPSDLRRRSARTHRAGHQGGRHHEPGHLAGRGRQARQRLARAIPPQGCSRCWTRRRTTRSGIITSTWTSTCPTSCSWPRPTWPIRSPDPCSTGWRLSASTATPKRRRWPSPGIICSARQLKANGLAPGEVDISDDALRVIVTDYTREAGVRSLERQLGKLLRKAATKLAVGDQRIIVDRGDVATWLGRPRFFAEAAERTSVPGVATGLAVTGSGGDVLFVEATTMPGESGLTITGQLGDVMKESAEIALSYVRSHSDALGLSDDAFGQHRFHLHVPAGAVPKDGPSAGVTMTTALVSLLTGRPVRSEVGMTGEVTLHGKVLPIGGVKQKVLAAHRAGLTEVILPARNGPDLDDVPAAVRDVMTFHLASDVSEVIGHALAA